MNENEIKIAALVIENRYSPSTNKRIFELQRNGLVVDMYEGCHHTIFMSNLLFKVAYLAINLLLRICHTAYLLVTRKYSVLLVHRHFYALMPFNKWMICLLRRKYRVVFDFDDSIFLSWWDKGFTEWMCKNADAVSVGSHFLLDYARRYNNRVELIPTSIDTKKFHPEKQCHDHFVIGWAGSAPSQIEYLAVIRQAIFAMLEQYDDVRFKLVGCQGDNRVIALFMHKTEQLQSKITFIDKVHPDDMPAQLNTFDVGLMPLTESPWAKGKCSLKALEYMACGVPTIASAVGENDYVIEHGIDGLLVKTDDEWLTYIKKLYFDKELRNVLSQNARQKVVRSYNVTSAITALNRISKEISEK